MAQETFNGKRISRKDKKKLAGSVNSISRQQAGAGTQGTTLGDNSGTGVNANKGRAKFTVVEDHSGPTGESNTERTTRIRASSDKDRLRSAVNNGRISARAAFGIQQDADEAALRAKTAGLDRTSRESIAASKLGSTENIATLGRDLTASEGTANREVDLTRANLTSENNALDRTQREGAAVRRDAQLGRQFDISQTRADTADKRAEAGIASDAANLELNQSRFDLAKSDSNLAQQNILTNQYLARQTAEADILQKNIDNRREAQGTDIKIAGVRAKLAANPNVTGEPLNQLIRDVQSNLAEAEQPLTLGRSAPKELTAREIDALSPSEKRAWINEKTKQYNDRQK